MARNDSYKSAEDKVLKVAAPGVLRNYTDADGDRLTASIERRPKHETLALNTNGSFTYRSSKNFNGMDTFVYRARDGKGGTDQATVTIGVGARPG